jgi:hypothetical protein
MSGGLWGGGVSKGGGRLQARTPPVKAHVLSLGLSNATEEQQVFSAIVRHAYAKRCAYKYRVHLIAPEASGNA